MANPLTVYPIPAFTDNYIWCVHDGCHAFVVDPGDAEPVMQFLSKQQLRLDAILITHHHHDHIGGLPQLTKAFEGIPVYGPHNPRIKEITHRLKEGQKVVFEQFDIELNVLEVPGHTLDHIAYHNDKWLFCGDTLFSAGCGRLFEGTPEQMLHSLCKLTALGASTQVFCTHEYTMSNLAFARAVEPENDAIQTAIKEVEQMREAGLPSLPSNLEIEAQINPFLRADKTENWAFIEKQTGEHISSDETAFAAVRRWKDAFRG